MEEVFLALKPHCFHESPVNGGEPGTCYSKWIHDAANLAHYMREGWHVYRCNGFQRVTEVTVELKLEKSNGTECAESPFTNH